MRPKHGLQLHTNFQLVLDGSSSPNYWSRHEVKSQLDYERRKSLRRRIGYCPSLWAGLRMSRFAQARSRRYCSAWRRITNQAVESSAFPPTTSNSPLGKDCVTVFTSWPFPNTSNFICESPRLVMTISQFLLMVTLFFSFNFTPVVCRFTS